MGEPEVHRTVEAVWRMESGRVIAGLTAMLRDLGQAEELAQDALVAALERGAGVRAELREGVEDGTAPE